MRSFTPQNLHCDIISTFLIDMKIQMAQIWNPSQRAKGLIFSKKLIQGETSG